MLEYLLRKILIKDNRKLSQFLSFENFIIFFTFRDVSIGCIILRNVSEHTRCIKALLYTMYQLDTSLYEMYPLNIALYTMYQGC